jgi:hypothetical protein
MMEVENGWKRLVKRLQAGLTQIGSVTDLKGLGLRDGCDCAFDSKHQIGFTKRLATRAYE